MLTRTSELEEAVRSLEREADRREALSEQLAANRRKLRALSSELAAIGERERQKLAVALHDRIGQALAFTKINLGPLRRSLRGGDVIQKIDRVLLVLD